MYRLGMVDRALVRLACWCFYRMTPLARYHFGKHFYEQHARIAEEWHRSLVSEGYADYEARAIVYEEPIA